MFVKCKDCDGRGRRASYMDWPDEPTGPRCETCKGHGEVIVDECRHCNGTGRDEHSHRPITRD